MGAMDAARAAADDADQTAGTIRAGHLAAVQAYATLALAEALGIVAARPTVTTPDPGVVYQVVTRLARDFLDMDRTETIRLDEWPAAQALIDLVQPVGDSS